MEKLPKLKSQLHGPGTSSIKSQPKSANVADNKTTKEGESNRRLGGVAVGNSKKEKRTTSLREATTRKTVLATRASADSRSTAVCKASHKTSSVSPAPSGAPLKLLNRYGFNGSIPPLKSGESTDSVNSILSDAKTNSDLNLNHIGELNGNSVVPDSRDVDDKSDVLSSISQASSGVTSCMAGKLKAKTKQLPRPVKLNTFITSGRQTIEVDRNSAAGNFSSQAEVKSNPKSCVVRSNAVIKSSQNLVAVHTNLGTGINFPKCGAFRPKTGQETEPQPKLGILAGESTIASCGAASRDIRLKAPSQISKKTVKNIIQEDSHVPLSLSKEVDLSDDWLRKKNMKVKLDKPAAVNKKLPLTSKLKDEPPAINIGKERKEYLTYGTERQKIAPYNRTRLDFGFSSMRTSQNVSKPTARKSNSGVVQNRIAELENTPKQGGTNADLTGTIPAPHKTVVRPTSLEKTPALPLTTNTVELSKPVFRKLQCAEGKKIYLSAVASGLKNTDGDVLVVQPVDFCPSSSNGESAEEKCVRDEKQNEKSMAANTNVTKNKTDKAHLNQSKIAQTGKISSNQNVANIVHSKKGCNSNKTLQLSEVNTNKQNSLKQPVLIAREKQLAEIPKNINIKSSDAAHSSDQINKESLHENSTIDKEHHAGQYSVDKIIVNDTKAKKCNIMRGKNDKETSPKEESAKKSTPESVSKLPRSSNAMTSSTESATSLLGRMSGKCTPILGGNKGEMDQDFFIEDEISDQPGLMFDDAVDLSFLEDDLFAEDVSSPSHVAIPDGRSRAESATTLSSIGEDLILDYELDDSRYSCRLESEPNHSVTEDHSNVLVNEYSLPDRCVSKEGLDSALVNENSSVNTRQPISSGLPSSFNDYAISSPVLNEDSYHERQVDSVESECIVLNRSTAQHIYQDVAAIKSLLLRLHKILNTSESTFPLNGETKSSLLLNLAMNNSSLRTDSYSDDLAEQNMDLKSQVVLLKQQMEEKNKTIHVLNQQLTQALQLGKPLSSSQVSSTVTTAGMISSSAMTSSSCSDSSQSSNAATQTDRSSCKLADISLSSLSRAASAEDGLGPTVSSSGKKLDRKSGKIRLLSEGHRSRNSITKRNGQSEVLLT